MALNATFPPARQAVANLSPIPWLRRSAYARLLPHISTRQVLIALLLLNIVGSLYWAIDRQQGLQDLGSFLHSGAAYREGLNPYDYHPGLLPRPISIDALNLNPPISVYLFDPLSGLDSTLLRYAFLLGTAAVYALGIFLLLRAYPDKRDPLIVLAVFSLAGLWHIFGYLQLYAPLFLAAVGAWLLMRRGEGLWAALLIGVIIAIKPNFALWPAFLILAGHHRIGFAALGAAASISAVPLLIDGPAIYRQWLDLTLSFDGLEWASNASLVSIGSRFGLVEAGFVAGVAAVGGLLALQWHSRPGVLESSTLGIIAALLLGPASWAGYTLFLLPYIFSRSWDGALWTCFLLLCTPFWLVHFFTSYSAVTNAVLGPMYGWAVLGLLAIALTRRPLPPAQHFAPERRISIMPAPPPRPGVRDAEPAA